MNNPDGSQDCIQYYKNEVKEIFRNKRDFHLRQARLPIEEKLRILIELQKAALAVRPNRGPDDRRRVWPASQT